MLGLYSSNYTMLAPRFAVARVLRSFVLQSWRRLAAKPHTPTPVGGDTNNVRSETNRLEKTLARFWSEVNTRLDPQTKTYEVCLDDKPLKTPLGNKLAVPQSKKQLAYLVGNEWDNLTDLKVKPSSLPLTSMAARAVDLAKVHDGGAADPELVAKIGSLDDIKHGLLRYLDTDTCVIFATHEEYDGALRKRQEELYRPLIAEFEDFFTHFAAKHALLPEPDYKVKLEYLDCETDGIRGNSQLLTTQNIVLAWLDELPIYALVAMEKAVLSTKSFLCGWTLVRASVADAEVQKNVLQVNKKDPLEYYKKPIEDIVELGNLETIFQTQEWGEVEDTHDVDKADWLRNLASAALVAR